MLCEDIERPVGLFGVTVEADALNRWWLTVKGVAGPFGQFNGRCTREPKKNHCPIVP